MGIVVRTCFVVWMFLVEAAYAATAVTLQYPVDQDLYIPGSYANRVFFAGQDHLGEDINLIEGTPIKAIGNGKLLEYRPSDGYGELVAVIEHDLGREYAFINAYGKIVTTRKILSIYGHIRDKKKRDDSKSLNWKVGDEVGIGEVIGYINDNAHNGDGAEHLHQGIRLQSEAEAKKSDPNGWFRGYEKTTDQGQYYGSAAAVIQIVQDRGIDHLCTTMDGSGRAICWVPASSSDVKCIHAKSWTVYLSYTNIIRPSDNQYCAGVGVVFAHYGDGMTGSLGGGGIGLSFNLKLDFDIKDPVYGFEWVAGEGDLIIGQTVHLKTQLQAKGGDAHDYMRSGKDTVETDFFVRVNDGDWTLLPRQYTKATNLPNGATHTETVPYTIPAGASTVSFKVKIDAEDEVYEANEGDNWSRIETFTVHSTPTINFIVSSTQLAGTSQPVMAGSAMGAKLAIRNTGNTVPSVGIRSSYSIKGPGTNNLWMQIADDGSDPGDLIPGRDQWEEIKSLVTAPTVPGTYELRGCADYQNAVLESNEDDNCLTTTFTVIPRPAPILSITRFEDKVGCCTTNTGAAPKPRIWVYNDGNAAPGANITVVYQVSSPVATGGLYQVIGYGTIEPRELPPKTSDEDQMDCDGCWRIPTTSAWKKQWHNFRACLRTDGGTPVPSTGAPSPGEVCAVYGRYSKK
ncbi:MAG: hypothetical protein E6P95_00130 [Candidatus Moraniibacteriota bacterium]|nr:MAG: hypothetical protein E6P95_00130 [Candidatus Moranbacteria bacterium]